jgi:hypothetical protein
MTKRERLASLEQQLEAARQPVDLDGELQVYYGNRSGVYVSTSDGRKNIFLSWRAVEGIARYVADLEGNG